MNDDDLLKHNIKGCWLNFAKVLKSRLYNIATCVLITLYTLLISLYFLFIDVFDNNYIVTAYYIVELTILGLFSIELLLHIIALGGLYFKDPWNHFDVVIIVLSIIFVSLDLAIYVRVWVALQKIKGISRLLRIFLMMRKINAFRLKKDISFKP